MAASGELSGRMLQTLIRMERDLALLRAGGYFTDEQWAQVDFVIHRGQYVFTDGPPKLSRPLIESSPLIDLSEPLEPQFTGENTHLLLPTKAATSPQRSEKHDDSDDTAVGSSTPRDKTASKTGTPKMGKSRDHSRRPASFQDAVSDRLIASDEDRERRNAAALQAFDDHDDHEKNAAAMWELDDDEEELGTRESQGVERASPPRPLLYTAAEAIVAIQSEIDITLDSRVDSRVQQILEDKPICFHWITPGLKCKFGDKCFKLHPPGHPDTSPRINPITITNWRQRTPTARLAPTRQATRFENERKKASASDSPKNLTCYWWMKDGKCEAGEKCIHSHFDTGKAGPVPFWERPKDDEDEEEEDDHAASRTPRDDSDVPSDAEPSSENDTTPPNSGSASATPSPHAFPPSIPNDASHTSTLATSTAGGMTIQLGDDEPIDWADEVNLVAAMEAAAQLQHQPHTEDSKQQRNTLILGAAAGGWGDTNMEQIESKASGEDWTDVVAGRKRKGRGPNGEVVW